MIHAYCCYYIGRPITYYYSDQQKCTVQSAYNYESESSICIYPNTEFKSISTGSYPTAKWLAVKKFNDAQCSTQVLSEVMGNPGSSTGSDQLSYR